MEEEEDADLVKISPVSGSSTVKLYGICAVAWEGTFMTLTFTTKMKTFARELSASDFI